jgi:ABC-type glutathione transport system ATPase component
MKPIVPPTQTWTAPWTASRLEVNGLKVPFPITVGMFETMVVRSAVVPGERVTVIGESGEGIGTVGVKPTSHDGTS